MMKTMIKQAFQELSSYYEHDVDTKSPKKADYERPFMVSMLPEKVENLSALDAGCAAGWYTRYLLDKGASVTAIDICSEMIEATKRRCPKATAFCCDIEGSLPFADDSFDLIVSSLVLHFIEDWDGVLNEFQRVLKTDGVLLFSICHPSANLFPFQSENYFTTELVHEVSEGNLDMFYYRRSMEKIFEDVSRYFMIHELKEPQPQESFQSKDAIMYKYLMKHPFFLVVKAYVRYTI